MYDVSVKPLGGGTGNTDTRTAYLPMVRLHLDLRRYVTDASDATGRLSWTRIGWMVDGRYIEAI